MSTPNALVLARLKEEAQSVSFDQVCRYIHVFSNLAGQIKYSNQKRILVEIALIKLCKPEMEQSSEAVLDRIRQVEERVEQAEQGAFTRVVTVASAEGTAPVSAAAKPKLEKAGPEEIQGIVRNWMSYQWIWTVILCRISENLQLICKWQLELLFLNDTIQNR